MNKESSRRISRREFIERTVLAAGVATVAYATGRCVVNDRELKRPPVKTPVPAEPTSTSQVW